jgi:hypothetical protein
VMSAKTVLCLSGLNIGVWSLGMLVLMGVL